MAMCPKIIACRVLVKGAGDLATGVGIRLHRAGFPVIMTEIAQPLAVRRTVAFAQAVFDGYCRVEEVEARRCTLAAVEDLLAAGIIPVLVDPAAASIESLLPIVVVDAIMAKRNTGTTRADAPLVIALGPGFTAGEDCDAVIETNRGHALGRVIWHGPAEADTGTPGSLPGTAEAASRVLRAAAAGQVCALYAIGDHVPAGGTVATIRSGDRVVEEVIAPFAGILRGLIHPEIVVQPGTKIGDLDPRADAAYCFTVSDKSLAIGGGVLEAILTWLHRKPAKP